MRWKEKLYERALKRPIDDQTKAIIQSEFRRAGTRFLYPRNYRGTRRNLSSPSAPLELHLS